MKTVINLNMDENNLKKYGRLVRASESFELAPTKFQSCKNNALRLSRIDYFILGIMSTLFIMAYFWVR
jgi:hypothetical protein